MGGDATQKMQMPAIDIRAHYSGSDLAFALIGLVLDRYHVIDRFEKLLHILALSTAMNILRRADSALKRARQRNASL